MRIVSGQYRGKAIVAPPGDATRPTSDRARQAVFNILEHAAWAPELHGARVVDLFAGSGALGLEALSRGAAFRRDATDLGLPPSSVGAPFDIAFLDPPYAKGLGEKALAQLLAHGWLKPGAIVMFERGREEPEPATPGFTVLDTRDYGAARVLFLKATSPAP
ncbi:MAG: 16S rRNA (guanine(966)-N(2))-methyltransferase RsmD [Caulobacter sp. 32-67-35]|nr:MAG: 16S rRNA (guanine(966)-N(2))-methyltransferase RsmD [Caulobacter sp. 32-67-35]